MTWNVSMEEARRQAWRAGVAGCLISLLVVVAASVAYATGVEVGFGRAIQQKAIWCSPASPSQDPEDDSPSGPSTTPPSEIHVNSFSKKFPSH